jgi:hypothetical protein
MAENMIKFLRGNVASLPQTATAGAVYFTKDEGLYLGLEDGSYHRYGDFITVDNVASLPKSGAHETCMYYCVSENILAKWDKASSDWVQINKQQTLAQLGGVAQSVYEAKVALLENADTDNATAIANLSKYVGNLPEGTTATTVIDYVNKKTEGIATDAALGELNSQVAGLQTAVQGITADYLKNADKTELEGKITTAQAAADNAQAAANGVSENLGKHEADAVVHITAAEREAWNGKTTMDEVEKKGYLIASDIAGKANSDDVYTKDNIDAKVETLENADKAINDKIGTVPTDTTVVDMIAAAQEAATYDDEEVRGLISDNADAIKAIADDYLKKADKEALQGNIDTVSDKVTTLIGSDADKSVRTIANEELAKQLIAEGAAESLDTLQEIATWIQSHPDDASAMNEAIIALQNKVVLGTYTDGEEEKEYATVKAYVEAAIAALQIGDYAKAADLTALAGRVSALETASATHALKTEVEAVSDALDEYKAAHKDDYTNKQIDDAIDADVKVVADALDDYKTAHKDDYTNKQIDDAIANAGHASATDLANHTGNGDIHVTTGDKDKWNAAEQNAKDYSDGKLATARTEISKEIDDDVLVETNRAKGVEEGLQSAIDTHTGKADIHVTAEDKEKWNKAQENAEKTAADALTAALTWGSF